MKRYANPYLILALLAGLVLGLFIGRRPRHHGPADRERRIARLSRKLELTAEQTAKVRAAFERGAQRMDAARAATREEVRAALTDVQRAKFDEMTAKRDRLEGRK